MSGGIFVGMDKNIMDGLNAVLEGQSVIPPFLAEVNSRT